ncbi:glycoside hydrolase family 5 protein [Teratosphaeria destructans]|uniref:glucan 1,3-beta-glucosidase n=1 Tax=Teratosphaeria destructans TaxID=418781 RepID=A0A9W7SYV4_9PEZI|nr:glycoside hydrolase family 5 protein [Teratosphaeria destructans]
MDSHIIIKTPFHKDRDTEFSTLWALQADSGARVRLSSADRLGSIHIQYTAVHSLGRSSIRPRQQQRRSAGFLDRTPQRQRSLGSSDWIRQQRHKAFPNSARSNATAPFVNSTISTNATTSANTTDFSGLRGVNIGGWLVLEAWMNADLFDNTSAVDQYTFDQTDGAAAKLQNHWDTYFMESDVQQIAAWGLNALRIPIGYWAYNNSNTPYISGADAYLEKAIGWARKYGLKVLVDCHGSPGSQNGYDNSGHAGTVDWQSDENLQTSISVLETMAAKYGAASYADVVFALEMVNEPISWGANTFATTQTWAARAYAAITAQAANPTLTIIMHDAFQGPANWTALSTHLNRNPLLHINASAPTFAIDTHLYQNQDSSSSSAALTQPQHIAEACAWSTTALSPDLPIYVGEFSAQTNVCANPDNSTSAGTSCNVAGCQCSADLEVREWGVPLKRATRMFFEAQVEVFERGARGWFLWSWRGPGGWGLRELIAEGVLGERVGEREFGGLCGNGTGGA